MTTWIYEYEDHTYPTQNRAREILGDAVCRPGKHKWAPIFGGDSKDVAEACECGLVRWNKHELEMRRK